MEAPKIIFLIPKRPKMKEQVKIVTPPLQLRYYRKKEKIIKPVTA